jgi:WD40 repeat protein
MRSICPPLLLFAGAWSFISASGALAQDDRRERLTPSLMLETGGRTGACDVLAFTADGKHLLATGDDKVVRVWPHSDAGLDPRAAQTLRWSVWRERRGSIFALALSNDPAGALVAVGGLGVRNGSVAVLRRANGEVVHALTDVTGKEREEVNNQVTWSLAFSPSGQRIAIGKEDGTVWLWDIGGGRRNDVRRLGKHRNPDKLDANRVRLVAFLDEDRLLSAARDGTTVEWTLGEAPSRRERLRFTVPNVYRFALSPDRAWLAAAGEDNKVELRSFAGRRREITLGEIEYPNSLAFDPTGKRLAVGIRVVKGRSGFFNERSGRVDVYDLGGQQATAVRGPVVGFYPEALAFHPDGQRLAVAGGDDFDIALWSLERPRPRLVSKIQSAGQALWGVGLSDDGRYLGVRGSRDVDPPHPNRRGQGPWRVFDLKTRNWVRKVVFEPVVPLTSASGWKIKPDPDDGFVWHVVDPRGKSHPLPLNRDLDQMPRCYTFLKSGPGKPPRLAVGHYWGFSLYELSKGGPRRVRLFNGHQGYVMALAPSADGKTIVTASRDQTVAAWDLEGWPSGSSLGATFTERLGKLFVDAVDPGGPGWEAGLSPGDEILRFAFDAALVEGGPRAWLRRLGRPEPNLEHWFEVQRKSGARVLTATRVRERPLWHFFPTRGDEWVLWRPFDYYYDASANGDTLIGWQVSGDVDQTPSFFRAAQFHGRFYAPDKVAAAVDHADRTRERVDLLDLRPPVLTLVAKEESVQDQDVTVTLAAAPASELSISRPERALLWIGDYQYKEWRLDANGKGLPPTAAVPAALLRAGSNRITLQCFSSKGAVSATRQVVVRKAGPAPPPRLFVVQVGVADYSRARVAGAARGELNLPSVEVDFDLLGETWKEQRGKLFQEVHVQTLLDRDVTATAVDRRLAAVAGQARPDDLLVFFINGHGYVQTAEEGAAKVKEGTFVFMGPTFDLARPTETGITADQFYAWLSRVPCRKLVLLSACHAGDATQRTLREPVRDLTPFGVGPVVLSAARADEEALAYDFKGSIFAQAIAEALSTRFADAAGGAGVLQSVEFVVFVKNRVAELFEEAKRDKEAVARQGRKGPNRASQTPSFCPDLAAMDRFPLAADQAGKR